MGKGPYIKRMVAVRNYSTNTVMKKHTEGQGGGRGLRIWNFRGKVKNLKFFWKSPFSVHIIRTL